MRKQRQFLWLTIVVMLVSMTACGPREIELPLISPRGTELSFETIVRSDYGSCSVREPLAILVTTRQEIDRLEGLIERGVPNQLVQLDFEQYFAIAVFRGTQATSGYDTIIERVTRRDNKIVVYVQFWDQTVYYPVRSEVTSPYHLIKVRKDDGVSQETELVLKSREIIPTPLPY